MLNPDTLDTARTEYRSVLTSRKQSWTDLARARVGLSRSVKKASLERRMGRRILVVEDNAEYATLIKKILESNIGLPVDSAATVRDAAALWAHHRHFILVVDMFLDGGNTGIDFLRHIPRGPRVVIYSGVAESDALTEIADIYDAEVVSKRDHNLLTDTISRILGENESRLRRNRESVPNSDTKETP